MIGRQETYKIVARHFAETIKVRLVFEEGACPATDGSTITLPTEMRADLIDETMGALLHETAHIRMTDFGSCHRLNENQRICMNFLEDIRIDDATYKLYPNARGFQKALLDSVINTEEKRKLLLQEPFPIQVLKGMILRANFYKPEKIYSETVCKVVNKFQHFIDDSKGTSPNKIEQMAIELCRLLMDETVKEAKTQMKMGGDQTQSGSGSQAVSGSGSWSGGQEGQSGDSGAGNFGIDIEQYQELSEKQQQAVETVSESTEKLKKTVDTYNKQVDKFKDLRRRTKLNTTKFQKLKSEYNKKQNEGNFSGAGERKQIQDRLKEKEDEVSDLQKQFKKCESKTSDMLKDVNSTKDSIRQAKQTNESCEYEKQRMAGQMFSQKPDEQVELLGFDALKDKDFTPQHTPIDNIDTSKSLDELIQEVLILKYEKAMSDEDGNKLNAHRLADLYTDYDNLWQADHKEDKKTHISFIIDASGSMDSGWRSNERHSSKSLALGALKTLCTALHRAIMSGAPADFSIHAFGNDVIPIINSYDEYKEEEVDSRYNHVRHLTGGGTNLSRAVTLVNEDLSEREGDDRVAIILTDACVNGYQLEHLEKEAMTDQAKFMFIGLNVDRDNQNAWELFGDYNITDPYEALPMLERSLMTLL